MDEVCLGHVGSESVKVLNVVRPLWDIEFQYKTWSNVVARTSEGSAIIWEAATATDFNPNHTKIAWYITETL
jgi:hypothetical protein